MKTNLYKSLTKYDSYMLTAYKADFIRALSSHELDELIAIGAELGIYYRDNHCPKCVLEFIKKLAVPYFEHQKSLTEKKSEVKVIKEKLAQE